MTCRTAINQEPVAEVIGAAAEAVVWHAATMRRYAAEMARQFDDPRFGREARFVARRIAEGIEKMPLPPPLPLSAPEARPHA